MTHEIKNLEFTPMIKNGKLQTILASLIRRSKMPQYHREQVILPDGDPIFIDVSQPDDWKASDPTVILMHGLCGCSASDYMLRMTHLFLKEGLRVVRMNLRGEGDLKKRHAKQIYHAGSSSDLKAVLEHLKVDAPESKNIVIGFSISGNILLLMLGQLGELAKSLVKYAIAVCPPADLLAGSKMINEPKNHVFQKYFIKSLLALMIKRHRDFSELGQAPSFSKKVALYDFDDQYTSIQAGFKSADDYYTKCSAIHVLKDIKVKTDVLLALDDPFVCNEAIMKLDLPENIKIHATQHGGHMGYLEKSKGIKFISRWMDQKLLNWVSYSISQP